MSTILLEMVGTVEDIRKRLGDFEGQELAVTVRTQETLADSRSNQQSVQFATKEIRGLQSLGPGWDGEDAVPVDESMIQRATVLLEEAALSALSNGHPWHNPSIAPSLDGGIDLAWQIGKTQVLVLLEPDAPLAVCISKRGNDMPIRREIPDSATVPYILEALREK